MLLNLICMKCPFCVNVLDFFLNPKNPRRITDHKTDRVRDSFENYTKMAIKSKKFKTRIDLNYYNNPLPCSVP